MKLPTLLSLSLALLCSGVVFAEEEKPAQKPAQQAGARFFQRLDKNKDDVLTKDEVPERLWTRISKADKNNDGKITKEELKASGSGAGNRPNAGNRTPEAIFKRLDKNSDGVLTKEEVPQRMWTRISKADKDKDGKITKEELKASLPGAGNRPGAGANRGQQLFDRADKNKDGKVSKDEVPAQLWERISKADKNNDDAIDKEEAAAAKNLFQRKRNNDK